MINIQISFKESERKKKESKPIIQDEIDKICAESFKKIHRFITGKSDEKPFYNVRTQCYMIPGLEDYVYTVMDENTKEIEKIVEEMKNNEL